MPSTSYTSGLGCMCFFTVCNLAPITCPTSFLAYPSCVCGMGGEGQFSPYGLFLGNTIFFLWWVVAALWHFYQAACGLMWLDGSTSSSANQALNLEQLRRFHDLQLHLPTSPQLVFDSGAAFPTFKVSCQASRLQNLIYPLGSKAGVWMYAGHLSSISIEGITSNIFLIVCCNACIIWLGKVINQHFTPLIL